MKTERKINLIVSGALFIGGCLFIQRHTLLGVLLLMWSNNLERDGRGGKKDLH